jgi:hypothetical protein
MTTADLAVAQQLDAEAAVDPSSTSTTTSTTSSGATTTTSSTVAGAAPVSTGASSGGTGNSGSGGLAVTGSNPVPLLALGIGLAVCGETARRVLKRRKRRAAL